MKKQKLLVGKVKVTYIIAFMCLVRCVCPATPLPPTDGRSFYPLKPEDPHAIYFTPDKFQEVADGKSDVSEVLQQAINEVKTRYNFSILFIPAGLYRISITIYILPAIRVIGYGKERPVFILAKNTPGFQTAEPGDKGQGSYLFWFVSSLPAPGKPVNDAGAGTVYSALSNVNLKIEAGNPSAVGLRTHFARHSFISHLDIGIGEGKAGIFCNGSPLAVFAGDPLNIESDGR
ncbi:MAG: glycosyl hydrolase family 28-related protein [Bacteroidota bacterium]